MNIFGDFEAKYSPKNVDDIVYPDDHTKTRLADLISGAKPIRLRPRTNIASPNPRRLFRSRRPPLRSPPKSF